MYDRDALRWRNASKTHKLHNLGSDINRRLQYWMDPAVVVVYIKSRVYIIMHMATVIQAWQLAWPRYATPIKLRWQLKSNRTLQLKGLTRNTNASPNTSYRQETSKCKAEDRVRSRESVSSRRRTEQCESPTLNERDRSACQPDAQRTTHYFLLHHQTVAYSWRPSAGRRFPAQTPTFQYRFVGVSFCFSWHFRKQRHFVIDRS